MGATWIKLVIHRNHDKVLRLSDLTESNPLMVLGASAEWFRWVDAHVDGDRARISMSGFRAVTAWSDDRLSDGMLHPDVDWVTKGRDGMLSPTRTGTHFGKGARGRALAADRASRHRNGESVTESAPDQTRPDEREIKPLVKPDGELRKAVESLRVSVPVGRAVLSLVGVTPEEIRKAIVDVRESDAVHDVGIVAAKVLLERRGQELPTRKSRPLAAALREGSSDIAGLVDVVRRRTGRNAC